jgi:putative transposase
MNPDHVSSRRTLLRNAGPLLSRKAKSPSLLLENLALRQQLVTLKRRNPRPSLGLFDKLFWVIARRVWSAWKQSLLNVTPETVVRWHQTGFCMYWRLISRVRRQVGRKRTPQEVRELIFRMLVENPTWGAPRIHGELRMLGFELSEKHLSLDEASAERS